MRKTKRLLSAILTVAMMLSLMPTVFAAAGDTYTYTFEGVTDGALSSYPASWGINNRINTTNAYYINYENGLGGKASNDGAMTFTANGDTSNDRRTDPLYSLDFRNNPIPGTTRMDFDLYIREATATGTGKPLNDYRVYIIPAISSGTDINDGKSFQFKQKSGKIKQMDSTETEIFDFGGKEGKWHKVSIVSKISEGSAYFTYYVDGKQIESNHEYTKSGTTFTGLAGLRIGLGVVANTAIDAKVAVDNIKVYSVVDENEDAAIIVPASEDWSVNNANVMTFTANKKANDLQTAFGNGYTVEVTTSSAANTGNILAGDQIKVTNNTKGVSECFYAALNITEPDPDPEPETPSFDIYKYTFDDGNVIIEERDSIARVITDNSGYGFTWAMGESSAEKQMALLESLGGHSEDDKALALVTEDFTTASVDGGSNSPAFTVNTSSIEPKDIMVVDTDVYFSGNQTRAEIRLDIDGTKDSSSASHDVAIDFIDGQVVVANTYEIAAAGIDGKWHNIVGVINITEKTLDVYLDGILIADGYTINLDTITKLDQIKFDSRYYLSGGVANGIFAIDNLNIYNGDEANYLTLGTNISDVIVNNATDTIATAGNIDIARFKSALVTPSNFNLTVSKDSGIPAIGDTVTITNKADETYKKTYTVSKIMDADFCENENFESANHILKQASNGTKTWNYTNLDFGANSWGFGALDNANNGKLDKDTPNDYFNISLKKGIGEKDSDDVSFVIETTGSNKGSSNYTARNRLTYGNPTGFADYEGKVYTEFDMYIGDNAPSHNIVFEMNYVKTDNTTAKHTFFLIINNEGMVTFNPNGVKAAEIFPNNTFEVNKWHSLKVTTDIPKGEMYVSIDGNKSSYKMSLIRTDMTLSGVQRVFFEQRFDSMPVAGGIVPNGIMAIDNFRMYRRADFDELRLISSNANITVNNGAGIILRSNSEVIDSSNFTSTGNTVTVNGDVVTVKNSLFSKEFKIMDVTSDAVAYEPAYNTIPGDVENINVTLRAYAPQDIASSIIILTECNEDGSFKNVVESKTVADIKAGDVISYSRVVPKTSKYRMFVFDSYAGLKPLSATKTVTYEEPIAIYMVGDSLMCPYKSNRFPQQGWGEVFKNYVDTDKAVVYNEAVGGESTTSILSDYGNISFTEIEAKLKEGDYVIVSYMHNDRYGGFKDMDGDGKEEEQYGCTVEEYKENLKELATRIKAKNATPIFVTGPNTGRQYNQHVITPPGYASANDPWDGSGDWPQAMRDVAKDNNVELIDLYAKHNDYINGVAGGGLETGDPVPEAVKTEMFLHQLVGRGVITLAARNNHPNSGVSGNNDNGFLDSDLTHFSYDGAVMLSNWVVSDMKAQGILVGYLK